MCIRDRNKIATFTGGRAAEEIVFGEITTGASNDIEPVSYTHLSRQVLEDGTYRDPYHVEPIELTKKRQRKIFLVQHLLGWARYLF